MKKQTKTKVQKQRRRSGALLTLAKRAKAIAAEYSEKHKLKLSINMPGSVAELDQWLREGSVEDHLTLTSDGTPLSTIMALEAARSGPTKERKAEIRARAETFMQGDQSPRFWNDMHELHFFERCIFEISSRNAIREIEATHEKHVRVGQTYGRKKDQNAGGKTVDDFKDRFVYWYGKIKKPNKEPSFNGAATMVAKESGHSVGSIRMAAKRGRWVG